MTAAGVQGPGSKPSAMQDVIPSLSRNAEKTDLEQLG
jgi:hypothetical protein